MLSPLPFGLRQAPHILFRVQISKNEMLLIKTLVLVIWVFRNRNQHQNYHIDQLHFYCLSVLHVKRVDVLYQLYSNLTNYKNTHIKTIRRMALIIANIQNRTVTQTAFLFFVSLQYQVTVLYSTDLKSRSVRKP